MDERALATNEVLTQYIEIHDDIFAPGIWRTLRRAIPMPLFFQAIDYNGHKSNLTLLANTLNSIISSIANRDELALTLIEYSEALLHTILLLQNMCEQLYLKSEGTLPLYSYEKYKQDLSDYQTSAEKYADLGSRLNQYFGQ